jgi:hypothetical protein
MMLRSLRVLLVVGIAACGGGSTAIPCATTAECPFGSTCEVDRCVAVSCAVDVDCPPGSLCNGRTCAPGCRAEGPDCPGEVPYCVGGGDEQDGRCEECAADGHCAPGFRCVDHVCTECRSDDECVSGVCLEAERRCVECEVAADCGPSYECVDNRCELGEVPPAAGVDLLFVIDNSNSMGEEQNALTDLYMDGFLRALEAAHGSRPDLHIGVISSDLGAGTDQLPGCAMSDRGVLQNRGCAQVSDRYLVDLDDGAGGRTVNYTGTLTSAVSCIARLGTLGCGFEQHLGSLRRALDPATVENAGFLRDDAALAIVILADEDDCTAIDTRLYDAAQTQLGPQTSYRCFEHGVVCTPDEPRQGPKAGCRPRSGSPWTADVVAIADYVKSRKPPGWVAVTTIVGPSQPVVVGTDPFTPANLTLEPSCVSQDGLAAPAIRLEAFAAQFPSRHNAGSICLTYESPLAELARRIAEMIE